MPRRQKRTGHNVGSSSRDILNIVFYSLILWWMHSEGTQEMSEKLLKN